METFDLVLTGGRVIDPESGLDAIRNVGITGHTIAAVSEEALAGRVTVDVRGSVVAPGFIDPHSHSNQSLPTMRAMVFDGITTALDLEAGGSPGTAGYDRAEREGRPVNYGFAANWAEVRSRVLDGVGGDGTIGGLSKITKGQRVFGVASAAETKRIVGILGDEIDGGALGIGILLGYLPDTGRDEYYDVTSLAAAKNVVTFTHARTSFNVIEPKAAYEGAAEIVAAAAGTGAHVHYCHINSTSSKAIGRVLDLVSGAQERGVRITTEAYPWGAGSTVIGAAYLAPETLPQKLLKSTDIEYIATGERVATDERLDEIRAEDPGGACIIHFLDESKPEELELIRKALVFPGGVLCTDGLPYQVGREYLEGDGNWPVPDEASCHPRTVGTYAKLLGRCVREWGWLTLSDAISRGSYSVAKILEESVPAMRKKGRLRVGADADVIVFDADTVACRATYENPRHTSVGFRHVIVNGDFVLKDSELVLDSMPGRAVRRTA
ncbi:MAG: amidohydrolase family protein [Actinomycetia bacterium]|nr:amidohydrolase family protein [Actinomycetes bacterium]